MNAAAPSPLIGIGLYPLREAARLVQLDQRTARRWAEGYRHRYKGQERFSAAVMQLALPVATQGADLTFPELLTLRLVRAFRAAGLGLPTIKRVAAKAAADFGLPTPFASRRFRTDGQRVFVELGQEQAANDGPNIPPRERRLIDVLTGQHQFAEVVEPSLFVNVEWRDDDLASAWWPLGKDRQVLLDPRVLFGAPRLADTSVPTATVAAAVAAEGGGDVAITTVADWYGVSFQAALDAVRYETEWLAEAA